MVRVSPVTIHNLLTPVSQQKSKLSQLFQKLQLKSEEGRNRRCGSDAQISLEELKCWSMGFEKLMASSEGRRQLTDFLKGEYSDENILFWQACEELKKETNTEKIEEKARIIYEDFISILSPKEVSLDSRVREKVNANMANPTSNTFDEAQYQIWTLMMRDSYPRFINSNNYRDSLNARRAECDQLEIECL